MGENKTRYSNLCIILLTLILIISSNIFTLKSSLSLEILGLEKNEHIKNKLGEILENYLKQGQYSVGYVANKENYDEQYLDFYAKRTEYPNYILSDKFSRIYPNLEVLKDSNGEKILNYKNFTHDNTDFKKIELEKLIIENKYATSFMDISSDQSLDEIEKKIIRPYIRVKYKTNGSVWFSNQEMQEQNPVESEYTYKEGNIEKTTKLEKLALEVINQKINFNNNVENILYNNEKYIEEFEAIYVVNESINDVEELLNRDFNIMKYLINASIAGLASILVVMILSSIIDYKKLKAIKIYNMIERTPFEIWMILFILNIYLFKIYLGILGENVYYTESQYRIINIFWVLLNTFTIINSTSIVRYIVYSLKSVYYESTDSFLFEKSIILKSFKFIMYRVNKTYNLVLGENLSHKKRWGIFYLILILPCIFIGLLFEVNIYFVFLWILSISIIFLIAIRIIDELYKIEEATDQIRNGDFEVKLDEDNSKLKNIVSNINNISNALDLAVEEKIKSERMKSELITNVSHDLKTPLTSIINYSDLASKENISIEDRLKYVEIINEKSLKLKTLIDSLFEVSKATSNSILLNKIKLNYNQILEQIITEWEDEFDSKNIKIIFNSNKKNINIYLDSEQTYRILENIFSNLYKYTQENTRVYIDLIKDEKTHLTIKNISKYELNITADKLKERFTRGDKSRNTDGHGLGMAIINSLVEIQGGKYEIEIDGDLFKTYIEF